MVVHTHKITLIFVTFAALVEAELSTNELPTAIEEIVLQTDVVIPDASQNSSIARPSLMGWVTAKISVVSV